MEIELSSMLPTDWRDWEDSLDSIGSLGPFEMDLGLDSFLLSATTADDFAEPFATQQHATLASPPDSPNYAAAAPVAATASAGAPLHMHNHHDHYTDAPAALMQQHMNYMQSHAQQFAPSALRDEDEELLALADGELFLYEHEQHGVVAEHVFKCESIVASPTVVAPAPVCSSSSSSAPLATKRKRTSCIKHESVTTGKRLKPSTAALDEHAERLYRRRYDILHEILEAWNTGGIEDMEEIADSVYDDDVTLISPDYTDGLRGVHALMSHWNDLLDAFPDGIMEEYEIHREDAHGEKLRATWVFSGTQIFPIFGVEPRHEKVCISGTSFFSFSRDDKIRQVVMSWNQRDALMKLMGVKASKAQALAQR